MKKLDYFLNKNVIIVDTNQKTWKGYVEDYNENDSFLDYEGESIDVRTNEPKHEFVCFGKNDIKSIELA